MFQHYLKKNLGDVLCEKGVITRKQLEWIMKEQQVTGDKIGEVLVEQGYIKVAELLQLAEDQLGVAGIDLGQRSVDYEQALIIPEAVARRHTAVAIGICQGRLEVAMCDPTNLYAIDDLELSTGMEILPVYALHKDIEHLIDQVYTSAQTKNIVSEIEREYGEEKHRQKPGVTGEEEVVPIVQLVDNILERCFLMGASDVHIEPFEKRVRIRCRVDGKLIELEQVNKASLGALTTRIKVLSGLNITEKRLPQDGRMTKEFHKNKVDLRVSILPTIYGEKTVIRFIYSVEKNLQLNEMAFDSTDYEKITGLLKCPNGIILLAGPTGSGKSTTMFSFLKVLNRENVNIVTVEDPVEHRLDGINQVEVNDKAGLTFASSLRSILRQDPDIMMIGEMRDRETCHMAIRAAITGHLVLSTIHTNDAVSAVLRLIDMGIEPYMVSAAVKGVISQRLVRKLCPNCKQRIEISEAEAKSYAIPNGTPIYRPKGCALCHHTGYKGRMAIHEVFIMDKDFESYTSSGNLQLEKLREKAIHLGMRTLWENGLSKVRQGETSLEEIIGIACEIEKVSG